MCLCSVLTYSACVGEKTIMPFSVKHLLIAMSAGEETAKHRMSCLHSDVVSAIHAGFQTLTLVEPLVIKSELSRNLCK